MNVFQPYHSVLLCIHTYAWYISFFLTDSRACSHRSRSLVGHCVQETDFNTQSCLHCLFCPGWGKGLTFQGRFVLTDSKNELGKTTEKSHHCRSHLRRVTGKIFGMSVAIRQASAKEESSQVSALQREASKAAACNHLLLLPVQHSLGALI